MKCGVVTFPGSNCNHDMMYALGNILGQEVVELWHKDTDTQNCELIVLPGGFSYGDYLRSGAIARFSPIMDAVINHANKGGLLLGICNGFQILCESGLLPGALLHNNNQKFICKNVYLTPSSKTAGLTKDLTQGKAYKIPIAHGEGRYFADDDVNIINIGPGTGSEGHKSNEKLINKDLVHYFLLLENFLLKF